MKQKTLWLRTLLWCLLALPVLGHSQWAGATLHAEQTDFKESGTYAEVERICRDWPRRFPAWVRCQTLGTTAEGRKIRALVASKTGSLQPARHHKRPVVLVIGGTHSGEIDGKDAGLILLRQLLASRQPSNPLFHMTLVFVPVFNVDGHEARGRHLRPNQNGPLEQGERTTARRINLNRDWMLSQTPEMESMLAWVRRWDPTLTIDLHVTDGVRYRHDVSISMSSMFGADPDIRQVSEDLLQEVMDRLRSAGHSPLDFYPVLNDLDDPSAGLVREVDTPRFSHVYATLRNRLGFLVEDHAWDDYKTRVATCLNTLQAILGGVQRRQRELLETTSRADANGQWLGGKTVFLDGYNTYDIGPTQSTGVAQIRGYRYTVLDPAPIVGGRYISYDQTQPQTWEVPLYDHIRPLPESSVILPEGGYIIPAAWAAIVRPHLIRHGLQYQWIRRPLEALAIESMRVTEDEVAYDARPFQGRWRTHVTGQWKPERATIPAGSIFVPIEQVRSLLAAHLLEPSAPDSLSSWGLFNTAYELSDYVASHREFELARWMYEGDAQIQALYGEALFRALPRFRAEYDARMTADDKFADDPQARMAFWMSRLPPYDPGYNRYPIYRIQNRP